MPFHPTTDYQPGDARGATCFFCGSAKRVDGGVAELLFRTDGYDDGVIALCDDGHPVNALTRDGGNVVICQACAEEIAGLLGWASPPTMEEHAANIVVERDRADVAEARAARAEALVAAVRAYDDATPPAPEPAVERITAAELADDEAKATVESAKKPAATKKAAPKE